MWICNVVLFSYTFNRPIMRSPYIKVVLVSILHQWVLKSEFLFIFLVGLTWQGNTIKKEEGKNKAGTNGGLPAKPASDVLSLAWQCDIALHVSYGVSLVLLVIWLNYFCLVYTNSCEYAMPSYFSYIFHPHIIHVPVSRTYNICLSHHILTSKYICSEELNCYSFFLVGLT